MNPLVQELTVAYKTKTSDAPLLTRVRELMEKAATGIAPASRGKSTSQPPLNFHILSLLMEVQHWAPEHEYNLRYLRGAPHQVRPNTWEDAVDALQAIPGLIEMLKPQVPNVRESHWRACYEVEIAIARWHRQCVEIVGSSPMVERYRTTEEAAAVMGKSPENFQVWAGRKGIKAAGKVRIGSTSIAVWDMDLVRSIAC